MLRKKDAFTTSSGGDPCTLGIWMATSVLECNEFVVVFMDTEGTNAAEGKLASKHGDVKKTIIFCTLMSSYLIYNSPGAIRQQELENMSYFANLAESIATHPEQKDDEFHAERLQKIFPDFLWLSKDNFLQYTGENGKEISPTEHLKKNILVRSDKANPTHHDMVVKALTTLFPTIFCKQIPPPGVNPLVGVKSVKNEDFDEAISKSIDFILNNITPKLGGNDEHLNGAILADLAHEYCNAMNKPNSIPNIELSWISATESVLEKIAAELVDDYDKRMQKFLNDRYPLEEGPISKKENLLPLDVYNDKVVEPSAVTIQSVHQISFSMMYHCLKEKVQFYMPRSSQEGDFNQRHTKILDDFKMRIVVIENNGQNVTVKGGLLQKFIKENFIVSRTCCEEIFEKLYSEQSLMDKIDLLQLEYTYNKQVEKRGPAGDEVYQNKLKGIPGAPQNISYEVIRDSQSLSLIVSWHKPLKNHQAVTEYCVQISCNKRKNYEVLSVAHDKTETKIENVICNAIYSVEVCSFNGLKKGECSKPVQVKTPAGRPCKPQKPKITLKSAARAIATVPALSDEEENGSQVKELKVIVGGNNIKQEKWKQHRLTISHREKEYQCHIDIPDTEECSETSFLSIQVQMLNDAGKSDFSDSENIPVAHLIPGPPQDLKAHSTAKDITVTWKHGFPNSVAASYYLVEFKERDSSWETKHNMYQEFSYTISNLKPASTYFVRIGTGNSLHAPTTMSMKEIKVNTLPDRPNRPCKPSIQMDPQLRSSNKGWLVSAKLLEEEENGSPVQEVVVQQRSNNQGQWYVQSVKVQQGASDIRMPINLLNATLETKIIHFQTIMKNEYGESDPSDVSVLDPSTMIPGPPSELSAVASFSSVKLTWKIPQENPASVDKYFVEMKSGDRWQHSTSVTYQDFSVAVYDLSPNCMYQFRVYTRNKDNNKLLDRYSNTVTVNTTPCRPKKPEKSGISLDVVSFDKANLTLLKPRFEDSGSNITLVQVMQFNEKKLSLNQKTVHKISDKELTNESDSLYLNVKIDPCTHFIRAILENEVGESDPSEFVGVAASSIIPGVPRNFGYVDKERRARQLILKWKPPDKNERAAKEYVVEMKICDELVKDAESRWRPIDFQPETKQNEHFAVILNLLPCTKYTFRMCAVNDKVKGQYTGNIEVNTTGSRPDNPPKPYVVQSDTHPDKAIVTIHMLEKEKQNGSPVNEATVEISENLENWQPYNFDINAINHQKVEVNLPNLKVICDENDHFFFCVKMRNKFGQSGPSENVSLPFSVLRPGKVQEFQAVCETAHVITLRWKPPEIHSALVSNYVIQKSSHSQLEGGNSTIWREQMIVDSGENNMEVITATIAEPRMNVERKLRVLAKNKDVNGLCSEMEVHIPDIIPGPPVNLREDKIQPRRIKVRWQEPTENKEAVSQYRVEVLSIKADAAVGDPLYTKKLSKVITNLDPLTQYKVKVTAMNISEEKSPSAETVVKTVMRDGWRYFFNGITAGQAARRPDPDSDLLSSGDEQL